MEHNDQHQHQHSSNSVSLSLMTENHEHHSSEIDQGVQGMVHSGHPLMSLGLQLPPLQIPQNTYHTPDVQYHLHQFQPMPMQQMQHADLSHLQQMNSEQMIDPNSGASTNMQTLQGLEAINQAVQEQQNLEDDKGKRKKKKRAGKEAKEAKPHTCMAVGCDKQIKHRRLCAMHQKQKERNGGKLETKEKSIQFQKGRTPTPFSKHANKYAKLKTFDAKVDEWGGGKEEGTLMLEAYLESSYFYSRFPKFEDNKIYEQIGKNIVEFLKTLPDKSPLRKPLIKAMGEGIPLTRLRDVLPVSKQTVINSKRLPDTENLLLTMKYKPNVQRTRKRFKNSEEEEIVDDSETFNQINQMGALGANIVPTLGQPISLGMMQLNTIPHGYPLAHPQNMTPEEEEALNEVNFAEMQNMTHGIPLGSAQRSDSHHGLPIVETYMEDKQPSQQM